MTPRSTGATRLDRLAASILAAVVLAVAPGCGSRPSGPTGSAPAESAPAPAPPAGGPAAPAPDRPGEPPARTFERDGTLWVERPGAEPQRLVDEARGYRAHVSPDGRWIAVDVVLFSNLQATRLFRRDDRAGGWAPAGNLSTAAWTRAADALGIALEDVEAARSSFLEWDLPGGSVAIELSGLDPDGDPIERVERVPLPSSP